MQEDLRIFERYMRCCRALRERRPAAQRAVLQQLGIPSGDILRQEPWAGVLRPSHLLIRDHATRSIVLAVRGTHSVKARPAGVGTVETLLLVGAWAKRSVVLAVRGAPSRRAPDTDSTAP